MLTTSAREKSRKNGLNQTTFVPTSEAMKYAVNEDGNGKRDRIDQNTQASSETLRSDQLYLDHRVVRQREPRNDPQVSEAQSDVHLYAPDDVPGIPYPAKG